MIVTIQVETEVAGHARHVRDVGDGYGRDPVLAERLASSTR
jgi:hypothetical protein